LTYIAKLGEPSAVVRQEAKTLEISPETGTIATFVAPGSVTRGEFGLFRWDMPGDTGGAPGGHFHRAFSESFYVVSGTVSFYNGSDWLDLSEGGFLYVPPGGIHGFRNRSGAAASMLIVFSPGIARERYFEELAEIRRSGRELSEEEWAELYARHDQVNL
jgi:mannose-6-phosphate isomerase-like protein (cupin superfamily)